VSAVMDNDTWLDADEAVSMGFADSKDEANKAAASISHDDLRARFDNYANRMAEKIAPTDASKVDTAEEAMNAELTAQVTDLQAKLTAIEAEKAELTAASAQATEAVTAEIETLKAEVARLSNDVATRDAEIAELKAAEQTAGEKAAGIVASLGIDPAASAAPAAPVETAAQIFAKLEGAEAVNFFRANRREILATATTF
jgi:septal ring factor EnvC (AmiA/AmiB activator)